MNEEDFVKFMRNNKKSERAINRYVNYMKIFENYLSKQGKNLEDVTPQNIRNFVSWAKERSKKTSQYVWGILTYSEFTHNELILNTARELIGELYLENCKLKDFMGVKPEYVEKLASKGIKTAKQMLDAGKTRTERQKIAEETRVPVKNILELVKLSNLARIPGIKTIRGRLYYDAGLDTLEKLAQWDPEEMREMLKDFIEKTEFKGMAPLPKEAAFTVSLARHLPKIVEY